MYPQFLDANYRQMWEYSAHASAARSAVIEHRAIEWNGSVVGLAAVCLKTIPMIRTGLAYVSGGPLTRRISTIESTDMFAISLRALREEYTQRQRMTLRLQPPLSTTPWGQRNVRTAMVDLGFHQARWPKPYKTIVVPLDRDLHDIRLGLHQKWRNCLNRAERGDVQMSWGTSPVYFGQFTSLLRRLESWKGFQAAVDPDLLADVNKCAERECDLFQVGLAIEKGCPIAGIVLSIQGDTGIYLLGASSPRGREMKASYLLQWRGMLLAKATGALVYDLGGIDEKDNPGVHRFKSRMGGEERQAVGPIEVWPSAMRGRLVDTIERIYRRGTTS